MILRLIKKRINVVKDLLVRILHAVLYGVLCSAYQAALQIESIFILQRDPRLRDRYCFVWDGEILFLLLLIL